MDKPRATPPRAVPDGHYRDPETGEIKEKKPRRLDWESLKTFDNGIAVGMVVTIIVQILIGLL